MNFLFIGKLVKICFLHCNADIYDRFAEAFTKAVLTLQVGNGLEQGVTQVTTTSDLRTQWPKFHWILNDTSFRYNCTSLH